MIEAPRGRIQAQDGEGRRGDFVSHHVPDDLVYGPVNSRRFGRSLGISCSLPGPAACRWHCPYCQLGTHKGDGHDRLAPARDVVAAIERAVSLLPPGTVDSVTVAGNGEPLDHPNFDRVAAAAFFAATRLSAESILLTNGDEIGRWAGIVHGFHRAYVKWDPGPSDGAWRAFSAVDGERRRRALRALPGLRIQAMLYGVDHHDGNDDHARLSAWLDDLRYLRPIEVHLTTLERPAPNQRLQAAPPERLDAWRRAAEEALQIPVLAFPAAGSTGIACDRAID
jgi:hypothetical protein